MIHHIGSKLSCLRRRWWPAAALLLAAAGAHAQGNHEGLSLAIIKPVTSCEQLAHVDLRGAADAAVTITSTGVIDTPKGPFCKVVGQIAPAIGFEVDLPQQRWTQRYLQGGCGGLCGMTTVGITNAGTCAPALDGEFVVAGTDMGHQGEGMGDASFGADPQKRIDFAYRGNHQTAVVAKALIRAFYGQAPRFSYFVGCSDGGREALIEAQRFPDDFDGISAGAPATLFQVQNSFHHAWSVRANQRADGTNVLLRGRAAILHAAVLAHCPSLSGVDDGLLQDPRACKVDPSWAQCPSGSRDTSKCLTAEEVAVARRLYDGPTDTAGRHFAIGGAEPGSESQWMLPDSPTGDSMSAQIASQALKYLLMPGVDPAAGDLAKFSFDTATFERVAALAPLYNGTNTNLRAFQARGGKLILWHGWSDTSITPAVSMAYYEGVQRQLGAATTDRFLRLFLLPGVGHCGGGDGYTQVDLLSPLMAWTERQQAPQHLMTAKVASSGMGPGGPPPGGPPPGAGSNSAGPPGRLHAPMMASNPVAAPAMTALATRPVYPYPKIARYTGKGDRNDGRRYQAATSPVQRPLEFNTEAARLIGPDNQRLYRAEAGHVVAVP